MRIKTATLYSSVKLSSIWMDVLLLLSFNLLLIASAWMSINVPFSPVPITGQIFGALLVAMVLGAKTSDGRYCGLSWGRCGRVPVLR